MSNTAVANIASQLETVQKLIQQAGHIVKEAAEIFTQVYDVDPNACQEWAAERGLSSRAIATLLSVGRGQMHDGLLLLPQSCGVAALTKCDIALQSKHITEPIAVVDPEHPDQSRMIQCAEMSPKQVSQVFAHGRIRSLSEQRTWLQEHRVAPVKPVHPAQAYKVMKGGRVEIGNVILTKRQLFAILQEME